VAPGRPFWPGEVGGPCLRLSIAGRDEAEIEEGLGRFGRALRAALSDFA
jgi:DNA-binding transcriptional MocR family regulator